MLDIMKIPALRVEINGKLIAVAGAEELSVLMGSVAFGAGPNRAITISQVKLGVMGLAIHGPQPRQLTWGNGIELTLGDRVTFEVAEVEQPSPPDQILRTPSSEELAAAADKEMGSEGDRKDRGDKDV